MPELGTMTPGVELDRWLSVRLFPGQYVGEWSTDTAAALNTLVPAMEKRGFKCWMLDNITGVALHERFAAFWNPDAEEWENGSAVHTTIAGAVALAVKAALEAAEQEGADATNGS